MNIKKALAIFIVALIFLLIVMVFLVPMISFIFSDSGLHSDLKITETSVFGTHYAVSTLVAKTSISKTPSSQTP